MNYKLLVMDIDGTLMEPLSSRINAETLDGIARVSALGVKTAIATGRSPKLVEPRVLSGFRPDYIIAVNGACVVDGDMNPISEVFFTREEYARTEAFVDSVDAVWSAAYLDGYYIFRNYERAAAKYYTDIDSHLPIISDEQRARRKGGLPYGGFIGTEKRFADEFNAADPTLRLVPFSDDSFDVMKRTMNKEVGVSMLAKSLGISMSEVVAIGDGFNDIEMLRAAGMSFAMGTADDEVKKAAKAVTGSVAENGALKAFERAFGI